MNAGRTVAAVAIALALLAGAGTARAEDAISLMMKGARFAKARNYPKALEAFQDAIRTEPTATDAYLNAGNLAKHLDRCREVLLYFRGFLLLAPTDPEAHTAKAALAACEAKGAGTLQVRTATPGVEVFIEGALVGRTPIPELRLAGGEYRLVFRHPDFDEATETVEVSDGQVREVDKTLVGKILFGYVEVRTDPPDGVVVYLDEQPVGTTPLKEKLHLQTKKYMLRLEKAGFERWIRNVTVQRDRTLTVSATLEPTPPAEVPLPPGAGPANR